MQSSWSDIRRSRQRLSYEVIARIEVIPDNKSVHLLRDVLIDLAQSAHAGSNEQRSLYEFEDSDRTEQ